MDETKECGRCKEAKPLDGFAPSLRTKASSWCRSCRTEYSRQKLGQSSREVIPVVEGHIRCGACKEFKPLDAFNRSQRQTGKWCRDCLKSWYRAKAPAPPPGFGTCGYCGKSIDDPGTTQRQYCDNNCKMRARYWRENPRQVKVCLECGVDLTDRRGDIKFCSDECAATARNRAKTPAQRRAQKLWSNYKITPEMYDGMLLTQGGRCAICLDPEPKTHHGFWHVDHCHKTGGVRGLLCGRCNTAIGQFQDDPEVIDRAAAYLRKARAGA